MSYLVSETFSQKQHSSLAITGLLAHDNETAEEILLRAHNRDIGAMVLAAVGYRTGLGGFPQEPPLAYMWRRIIKITNGYATSQLVNLLLPHELPHEKPLVDAFFRMVSEARQSPFLDSLQQANVIDIQKIHDELKACYDSHPEWGDCPDEHSSEAAQFEKWTTEVMHLMRESTTRCLTGDETDMLLNSIDKLSLETLIFFAATSHHPETEQPDWNDERLIDFINVTYSPEYEQHGSSFHDIIKFDVSRALTNTLSHNPHMALEHIRNAHKAFTVQSHDGKGANALIYRKAAREMALHYKNGTLGFLKNDTLSFAWSLSSALLGDPESALHAAVSNLFSGARAQAWFCAYHAYELENASESVKRAALHIMKSIKRYKPDLSEKDIMEISTLMQTRDGFRALTEM